MGLDVYLYRYEDKADAARREAEFSQTAESTPEFWKDANDATRTALAERLGLDQYGTDKLKTFKIQLPSAKYPDHYFKIGYFRSSYNAGGIDHVMKDLIDKRLSDICGADDEYEFQPDWQMMKINAQAAINEINQQIQRAGGPVQVKCVAQNMFSNPADFRAINNEKAAMDAYIAEHQSHSERKAKDGETFSAYSNRNGEFYFDAPIEVHGIIPGVEKFAGERPCHYLIIKGDLDWYVKAIEIVIETAEYVLSQPDPDKFWLHWSS